MIVGHFFVEPYKALGHFNLGSDQVPLPRQVLRANKLRLRLTTVGAPLGIAGAVAGDRRSDDLVGPLDILVYVDYPECYAWKIFRPPVSRHLT
jgi:hypothetical protein